MRGVSSPGFRFSGLVIGCFLAWGCSATQAPVASSRLSADLMDSYLSRVVKFDGIDKEEALILARSQMFFQGRTRTFNLDKPQWLPDDDTYWVLSFESVRRTLADVIADKVIVIFIDKHNGAVIVEE